MLKSSWPESGGHVREWLTQTLSCGFCGTGSSSSWSSKHSNPGWFQVALWFLSQLSYFPQLPSRSVFYCLILVAVDIRIMPAWLSDRNEIQISRMCVSEVLLWCSVLVLPETDNTLCYKRARPHPPSEMEITRLVE